MFHIALQYYIVAGFPTFVDFCRGALQCSSMPHVVVEQSTTVHLFSPALGVNLLGHK